MPEPGTYKFFDRDFSLSGNVKVHANGRWEWSGRNRTRNSGTWVEHTGNVTDFTTKQGIVAKRFAKGHCNYDSTKPWFNTNLVDVGALTI